MNLPDTFLQTMKDLLQDDYEAYLRSFEEERLYGLRINTLKIGVEDFLDRQLYQLEPVKWCPNGFYYQEQDQPTKNPYYYAGLYYIQEPSAMSSAAILPIEPGEKVLDLCAAPGGKSTQLLARLKGEGVLVSNDISTSRCIPLLKNLELFGGKNFVVTSEAPKKLTKVFTNYFDKILIDAPCSGEGMFRKDSSMIKNWEKYGVDYCSELQKDIIREAHKMLKPGGMMLYSTCTFSPVENEQTISDFLLDFPEYQIVEIDKKSTRFQDGMPEWVESGNGQPELKNCARLWPHRNKGEGHFLALLRKNGLAMEASGNEQPKIREKKNGNAEWHELYTFFDINLNVRPENFGVLKQQKDKVYAIPKELPSLKGIRLLREGVLLGELKKNRFEPSQALAMVLNKDEAKRVVNFNIDDKNVIKYLKGETLQAQGENGWNLVCVDGFPLGWCKINNGQLKNKYSKGWRWQ